jgi:hypothetical protein
MKVEKMLSNKANFPGISRDRRDSPTTKIHKVNADNELIIRIPRKVVQIASLFRNFRKNE